MKANTVYCPEHTKMPNIPFPNAATKKEVVHKLLDMLLMAAMGAGAAASLLFLLALV